MTADLYHAVNAAINAATPAIARICGEVWELAELSLEEVASANVHMRELEAAGFTITSRGTSGQATAFIAEWEQGTAGPRIGFLPEYDALPGIGHACGHKNAGLPTFGRTELALKMKAAAEMVPLVRLERTLR